MKLKYLYLFWVFWVMHCKSQVIIRDYTVSSASTTKSIALVNFFPYYISQSNKVGRRASSTSSLNYNRSMKSYFKSGQPVEKFQVNGIRKDIPESKVKEFVDTYLQITKKSGIDEILKLVEINKISEQEFTYSLKNIDADYIVVGYLLPEFRQSNLVLITVFSKLYSALTLGTVPSYENYSINPTFVLYDKNLNRLEQFTMSSNYSVIQAWWAREDIANSGERIYGHAGNTNLSKVYIPEIEDANTIITSFINNRPE